MKRLLPVLSGWRVVVWGLIVPGLFALGHANPLAAEPLTADSQAATDAPPAAESKPAAEAKPSAGAKAAAKDQPEFVRVLRSEQTPIAMQTAVVRYHKALPDGSELIVDLVGAVHVGDKLYYKNLNEEFRQYDSLLYELVAPEEANVPKPDSGGSGHPIGMMQDGLKGVLALEHQLSQIDYTSKNFVHADMTPEQFSKSMADRGESFMQMFFRMMGHSMAQQGKSGRNQEAAMLVALFSGNRELALKRVMAEQLSDLDATMSGLSGPEGSTILTERNKVCMEVLQREIDAGKKKLGIFYGAAHLPDMDERLLGEFGMRRGEVRWLTAWDMSDGAMTPGDTGQPKQPESSSQPKSPPQPNAQEQPVAPK